jgi:hypothetical protein
MVGPMLVGAQGREVLPVDVPNDPALRGATLFAQALSIDPVAFPLAFLSAAVQSTVAF